MNTKKFETTVKAYEFFNGVIDITGTYFLSDYLENELSNYFDESDHMELFELLDRYTYLKADCIDNDVDIHGISCEVAELFLKSQGI